MLDVPYFDLVGFYHDGKRNVCSVNSETYSHQQLSVYTQVQGHLCVHAFRTPDFVKLMEQMLLLRSLICGNLPAVSIEGPPVQWTTTPEKFKPTYKTQHFCGTVSWRTTLTK